MIDKELAMQAAGWMYAKACHLVDEGIDIRQVEVPDLMHEMESDIPEIKYEPASHELNQQHENEHD